MGGVLLKNLFEVSTVIIFIMEIQKLGSKGQHAQGCVTPEYWNQVLNSGGCRCRLYISIATVHCVQIAVLSR